jgi:hypothetical protein
MGCEIGDQGGELFCCTSLAFVACVALVFCKGTGNSFCPLGPALAWVLAPISNAEPFGPPNGRQLFPGGFFCASTVKQSMNETTAEHYVI